MRLIGRTDAWNARHVFFARSVRPAVRPASPLTDALARRARVPGARHAVGFVEQLAKRRPTIRMQQMEPPGAVLHLDINYFFAQVEELRLGVVGRPLGVQQNMEVACVNYAARARGLYNRISVEAARKRCPELMLVRGDNGVNGMQRYRSASQQVLRSVMAALDGVAGIAHEWEGRRVEKASFDDFFVQLPLALLSGDPLAWCRRLRKQVVDDTGLRCSIGIARTKLLAMLATKRAKSERDGVWRCETVQAETELLEATCVSSLRGAGVVGLAPAVRATLQTMLRKDATLGDVRALQYRHHRDCTTTAEVDTAFRAVDRLFLDCCDGSVVSRYEFPKGLSVECSVRPTDREPATELSQLRTGFMQLAPLLLSRMIGDQEIFGKREIATLVVKWKLFPGATKVRQTQVQWPSSLATGSVITADALVALATQAFEAANVGSVFSISRVVLALAYATSKRVTGSESRYGVKRKRTKPDPKQRSITDMFQAKTRTAR